VRKALLLFGVLFVVAVLVFFFWPLAPEPAVERPPAAPVERPPSPLQADAEGSYVASYHFSVSSLRFMGFTLRPDAFVTFAQPALGSKTSLGCVETVIKTDRIHLRCDAPEEGSVTIDGTFLNRVATTRAGTAVVSAIVTLRARSGEILYSARDRFEWQPAD
jgi:hypothetical protein